ncbi:MAG: TolC family protein [Bacteroidales bacterium]|nr:TolC family protein [Bacteroidales bacterium]
MNYRKKNILVPFFLSFMKMVRIQTLLLIIGSTLAMITRPVQAQDTISLAEVIATGLEQNFSIRLARIDATIAENNNTLGKAGFLPTLTATGTKSWTVNNTKLEFFSGDVREGKNAHSDNFNPNATLTWTIFDGFNMWISKKRLNELENMGEIQARIAVEENVIRMVAAYYQIVQQEMLLDVIREALSLSLERKKLSEARIRYGADSKLDLLQALSDLDADSARLLQAENIVQQLKADLNVLMGRDPQTSFFVKKDIPVAESLLMEPLLEKSLENNAMLLAARSNTKLASLGTKQAMGNFFPRLSFYTAYNYNISHAQIGIMKQNKSYGYTYGLTASFPLFEGFNRNTDLKNARLLQQSAEISYQAQELALRSDVYKTYRDYSNALALIRMETRNLEMVRENVAIAAEKYRLGTLSAIDLRTVQQKQIDAESRLISAKVQAKQAEQELLRLSGELYKLLQE